MEKDFLSGNPSEDVKSMVIRESRCEGHLSVCRREARLLWHDKPQPTSFPLHLPTNPFPSSARHRIIEHYNLFHDGDRRRSWGKYNAWQWPRWWPRPTAMAAPSPLWQRIKRLRKLSSVAVASSHSESWSDVSKMAPALTHSLRLTAPLSQRIAFFSDWTCKDLLMENSSAK